jgi:hypothetical protein
VRYVSTYGVQGVLLSFPFGLNAKQQYINKLPNNLKTAIHAENILVFHFVVFVVTAVVT